MLSYTQLIPLVILIPAIGSFINLFWGAKMGERAAGYVASTAAVLTFIISVLIFNYLNAAHGLAVVIDPPIFDSWIRIGSDHLALEIPWQFRVDSLTAVMLLVVTGVGSLIHIYSIGYIHGDPKATRFFAYLNLFLMFMLVLVTGNNYLMMFVGWEGVGVCSFLLIGYWWDKKGEIGWQNGNAARKAMLLNRVGDFGLLMGVFLIFWTFGTLNYYSPGEEANPPLQLYYNGYGPNPHETHSAEEGDHSGEESTGEEGDTHGEESSDDHGSILTDKALFSRINLPQAGEEGEGAEGEGGHGGLPHPTEAELNNSLFTDYRQLGVFGQAQYLMSLPEGDAGRLIDFGSFQLDIQIVIVMIVLFLLLGATGKSAQIPLFVWLPDAMAGPTPVSALMHAATMVTAGVYLLVRSSVLLELAPEAKFVIAVIGAATALVGGFTALGQWDVKRVLAYSTVSQLGFMVAAVGIGAYVAAIFHLVTHAVFKALLFLGSGSVIHGVEHGHHHVHEHGHHGDAHAGEDHHDDFDPQDMRNMGGLAGKMPITFLTYLMGTFALMGLPFFAGFWSKDEILAHAFHEALFGKSALSVFGGQIVFGLLIVSAGFTAFYMWRQIQMVFFGTPRSEAADHAPESVAWMTVPLIILAIGSIFVGLVNIPGGAIPFTWFLPLHSFGHFLESSIPSVTAHPPLDFNWPLAIGATAIAFGAIFLSHSIYAGNKAVVSRDDHNLGVDPLYKNAATRQAWSFANARVKWDDFYHAIFLRPYERIGQFLADVVDWRFLHDYFHDTVIKKGFDGIASLLSNPIDVGIIDGTVNGVGKVVKFFSGRARGIQTGYVRTYAVALLFGVVAVIVLMLAPLLLNGS